MIQSEGFVERPFFGKTKKLLETLHSLDEKWYVEFWDIHYYFLGIEVYSKRKEVVKQNGSNGKKRKTK